RLTANEFHVSRIIMYRNEFLPQITGIIRDDLGQTRIDVNMRLRPVPLIFTIVSLAVLGGLFIRMSVETVSELLSGATDVMNSLPGVFFVALLLIAGIMVTVGWFRFEA